jgi:hypothetical protein
MFLRDFDPTANTKIKKANKLLSEQFGIKITGFPRKNKLEKLKEASENNLVKIRGSNKKFHLDPEYAKFLGIRDIVDTMIAEGIYAESPKYMEMKQMINASVQELMDSGYTMEEASTECMNRFRRDPRWAYDDEHVLPIVMDSAKKYMEACSASNEAVETAVMEMPQTDLNEKILRAMAEECRVKLEDAGSYDTIEEKINMFASVTGKSRDSVVGFLNSLPEAQIAEGLRMFGRKVAEANKFTKARKDAIKAGKKEFEVDGTKYPITGDPSQELEESMSSNLMRNKKKAAAKAKQKGDSMNETMFDDLIRDLLREEVDVQQAEVVMAVRALADDIQSQVERLGKMVNEDLPAITDQMRSEMGASQAQSFYDSVSQTINQHLEATRQLKLTLDQSVGSLSGGEMPTAGLGDQPEPGLGDEVPDLDSMGDDDIADAIPAAAGPDDAPLGRAEV